MSSKARKRVKTTATVSKTSGHKTLRDSQKKQSQAAKFEGTREPDVERAVAAAVKTNSMESGIYLNNVVSAGLPVALALANKPIIDMMITHAVLPRKTWDHAKKSSNRTLSPQNSERLVRTLRMVEKAKDTFGDENALAWIERPTSVFEGKAPIEMLTNESGSRAVELFLDRTMHGFNA